jgi:hypothetical protein
MLLGLPPSQAQWADRLTEVAGWLEVELTARQLVDADLGALRPSAARVRDLVLGNADGLSSLAASLSMVAELLKGQIDTTTANGVCWGTRSALVAALSHFLKLKSKLELLGSERNSDLTNDQADTLWPLVSAASDSLASLIPSSIALDPPDDARE